MKGRIARYGKRTIAATLAVMLTVQPVSGEWGTLTVRAAGTEDTISVLYLEDDGTGINLADAATDLYVGSDWAGTAATLTEEGKKSTINVSSYGWNGEWGLQYILKELDVVDNAPYTVECDILSSIDKKIVIKLDDSGLIEETLELKAGEPYHFSKEATAGTFQNKNLYFAIG